MRFDYARLKEWPIPSSTSAWTRTEAIAFARGIGCGQPGALFESEQRFVRDDPGLQAHPMMALTLTDGVFWTQDPATGIDWTKTIHAEERLTLHRPLPVEGRLRVDRKVLEIYDKGAGKGALMIEDGILSDSDVGAAVAEIRVGTFLAANGGQGGSSGRSPAPYATPTDRPPDATVALRTPSGDSPFRLGDAFIAALRLGDLGKGQAVLRGVGAFGVAGRGLLHLCCGMQPARVRSMSLRYAAAMYSDEEIVVEVWQQAPGEAAFQVRSLDRGVLLLKNGQFDFLP